ncbi:hypothetical protein GGQ08_001420 [Salinibacter ruber]|uniref:hypothetical protein n=1 Tax=Salinibacter ruber TaxID=146919 RepID=UPI00216953EF|nr:hypothetical protein [Salinibacter ruber]MCS3650127.1 hypothetical protein [Salinibacter ruber]MCS3653380.1 hypothetical protein [Salinibacter ruber]
MEVVPISNVDGVDDNIEYVLGRICNHVVLPVPDAFAGIVVTRVIDLGSFDALACRGPLQSVWGSISAFPFLLATV